MYCPKCNSENYGGNGDNTNDCFDCGYHFHDTEVSNKKEPTKRLEYLRGEIEAERISYGELFELQSLVKYIKPDDVQLLEWAGVPEH